MLIRRNLRTSLLSLLGTTALFWTHTYTGTPNFPGTPASREEFFQDIVGMPEDAFKKSENCPIKFDYDDDNNFWLNDAICCGHLNVQQIGELITDSEAQLQSDGDAQSEGFFQVIQGNENYIGDVGYLQSVHPDAVFQVASNFNALETTSASVSISKQNITGYINDPTQGPAASISAASGLILRHYFWWHYLARINSTEPSSHWPDWQQTDVHFLNLLDGTAIGSTVTQAGYPVLRKLKGNIPEPTTQDYANMKVLWHGNMQVTHGQKISYEEHRKIIDSTKSHTVNQVFAAALDFGRTNYGLEDIQETKQWTQFCLNAAYEGCIRSAYLHGKKKVFLTLIGGGVFDNPFDKILHAMTRLQEFVVKSGLEVYVVLYAQSKTNDDIAQTIADLATETAAKSFYIDGTELKGTQQQAQEPPQQNITPSNRSYVAPLACLTAIGIGTGALLHKKSSAKKTLSYGNNQLSLNGPCNANSQQYAAEEEELARQKKDFK